MRLNLLTAVTVVMVLALGFTVLATVIRWVSRTHPGYARWAIAGLLLVLSLFLLSLRSAPGWINTVSADAGIGVASILYLEGVREFRDLPPRRWLAYAGGVVTLGAVAYFYYIVPSMNERAFVMSVFCGVILGLASIRLLRGIPRERRFGQTFAGWMFALCAATFAARALYCHFGPPMNYGNCLTGFHGLFFIAIVSEMAAFSTGLAVMADERVMLDLHNVKERVSAADAELVRHIEVEAALRESEERFRRVFEEGPLGLALVGKDYRFVKVNSALCQMVGYPERELVQKSFPDITHPDDLQADVVLAEKLFRGEIPYYRLPKRYVKKNGEVIWINLTASVIRAQDGNIIHGLAMIEDITDHKRTQAEALAMQKLESVGTLANGIAHDFNNLLGAVGAQAELAISELDAGISCKEELKAILDVAMRGSEIVRQLMIYAGKESAVVEAVDLSEVVHEMIPLLKVSVSKHIVLISELGKDLPPIGAPGAQLRQILLNLITNASDAIGDRAGVIRVVTRRVNHQRESVAASEMPSEGDYICLEVSDTGCGISLEAQAKIFDPFFTTKTLGRGLGLAVVSGIVRGLGGEIHLASELGKGTTFQLFLPTAKTTSAATSEALQALDALSVASPKPAVLVVEDEDVLRQAVVKTLHKAGLDVFEAADGSTAINLLRANSSKIDVILLDMTIPGASSEDVVAEATNLRADIRVILTSAYGEERFSAATRVPQIISFIRKPFRLGDLVKAVCHPSVS